MRRTRSQMSASQVRVGDHVNGRTVLQVERDLTVVRVLHLRLLEEDPSWVEYKADQQVTVDRR